MKIHVALRRCLHLALAVMPAVGLCSTSQSVVLQPDSAVWLVGDSTLHPFTSRTTSLKASGTLDPQAIAEDISGVAFLSAIVQHNALKTWDVLIPVQSLQSKESGLDKNMYKALKESACPQISFHLTHYDVAKNISASQTFHAAASGSLSIACQEHPVTLQIDLTPGPDVLQVQGQYTLRMSDYGVKPPTLMLGTIKVKDPVVIHFDLRLVDRMGPMI